MSIQIRIAGVVAAAIFASSATAQTAVEWKESEGGNGHWYRTIARPEGFTRPEAESHAQALGGHLFTGCGPELSAAMSLANALSPAVWGGNPADLGSHRIGPWIGLISYSVGSWSWVDGSTCTFDGWDFSDGQPNNAGEDSVLLYSRSSSPSAKFHDIRGTIVSPSYLLEFDADCNGDGIVDYGQILRGELIDLNSNGVPDICETSINSVIPPSVPSQGGSTITIRGNFPPNPTVKVGGVFATDVNRVSVTQITATVPELLPGMASVQVNDFTLPDAIYIRPECGSDLDQNGSVDTADISIILLDFGPCYEGLQASGTQSQDPPKLLAAEPAPKPVTAK